MWLVHCIPYIVEASTLISLAGLLNDGSAMVFYTIFSALFLSELGIPGVGETISTGQGFALFFRMSFGGAAIGMVFSVGLVLTLYLLNRRLTGAENVVQVCSTGECFSGRRRSGSLSKSLRLFLTFFLNSTLQSRRHTFATTRRTRCAGHLESSLP